jgi:transposase
MHAKKLKPSSTQMREARRMEAVRLIRAGATQADVARQFRVSREAVRKWWDRYRAGGLAALRARRRTGHPPRVSRSLLRRRLPKMLVRGAEAHGFSTDIWTLSRVAQVIEREFGVHYSVGHTWRLLVEQLEWSCQKPERRARERDERAVQQWRRELWPQIKKTPATGAAP